MATTNTLTGSVSVTMEPSTVALRSGGSFHLDGRVTAHNLNSGDTTYAWSRVSGTGGSLTTTWRAWRPIFNAPTLSHTDSARTIVFKLVATNKTKTGEAAVTIQVAPPPAPPPQTDSEDAQESSTKSRTWHSAAEGQNAPPIRRESFAQSDPWSLTDPLPLEAGTSEQSVWSTVQTYTDETDFEYGDPVLVLTVPAESESDSSPRPNPAPPPTSGTPPAGRDGTDTFVAPYWSRDSGGFVVAPAAGRSSVTVECGSRTTEYKADDGLVVRSVRDRCARTGLRITGAAPGGWYWQHGSRNAAVAPLLSLQELGGGQAVVPAGVTVDTTGNGTWISHGTARLVGIVPHLAANECSEYVTPFWQGHGGIVARPIAGRSGISVRVQCGRTWSTSSFEAGDDGVVAELISAPFCMDSDGSPKQGRLAVTGADPGGWFWINGERNAAVAPLVCPGLLGGPAANVPAGVTHQQDDDGTWFKHDIDRMIGVVPHLSEGDQ
ncbi:MAG: hypothetical protein F4210_05770 [Holophagales bacterium]|nr:hypothetical protein [Holophagales bacterium]MYF95004.1 hypothetical protein [Holophagales bacterium]